MPDFNYTVNKILDELIKNSDLALSENLFKGIKSVLADSHKYFNENIFPERYCPQTFLVSDEDNTRTYYPSPLPPPDKLDDYYSIFWRFGHEHQKDKKNPVLLLFAGKAYHNQQPIIIICAMNRQAQIAINYVSIQYALDNLEHFYYDDLVILDDNQSKPFIQLLKSFWNGYNNIPLRSPKQHYN